MYWCDEWRKLGRAHGVVVEMDTDPVSIQSALLGVLESVREAEYRANLEAALGSRYHQTYATLNLELGNSSYINANLSLRAIKWIYKARVGVIYLNYKPWIGDQNYVCSLCNLRENEDVFHYICRCPILAGVRKRFLQKKRTY